jgi:hypothetical protein
MNWFEKLKKLFKKKENRKEQIIAIKPTEFLGSKVIKFLKSRYKYFGLAYTGKDYCWLITYPHFPPCDITLDITNTDYNFILLGVDINCELIDNDGIRSWWNLPIIQLIKINEENYDIQYSYELLKKLFKGNIEILKYEEI